jgi:hypothetical protein
MKGYITEKIQEKQDAKYRHFDHMCEKMEQNLFPYPELFHEMVRKIREKVIDKNENPKKIEFDIHFGPAVEKNGIEFPKKWGLCPFQYLRPEFERVLENQIYEKHERLIVRNAKVLHSVWNAWNPDATADLVAQYVRGVNYNCSHFALVRKLIK